jgi:hypothetical protein
MNASSVSPERLRYEGAVVVVLCQLNRVEGFRSGADLVELYQCRVGDCLIDSLLQDLRVRAEDVIADRCAVAVAAE